MKNNILILTLFGFWMTSCTPKPLEIDLPQAEQKLVIASQVIPGNPMVVTVSRSTDTRGFNVDEDDLTQDVLDQLLVDSGLVTISYNGFTDTLFRTPGVPGFYVSLFTPRILNTNYTLYVKDYNTGMEVTSSAFMLPEVPLDTAFAKRDSSALFSTTKITYSFSDPQGEDNWYMVNFYARRDSASTSSGGDINDNSQFVQETAILKDKNFSSSVITASQTVTNWDQDTVFVSISNISEGYYDYLNARIRAGSLFTSLAREPVNYPTNVNGGYGYFTTHIPSIRIVEVD